MTVVWQEDKTSGSTASLVKFSAPSEQDVDSCGGESTSMVGLEKVFAAAQEPLAKGPAGVQEGYDEETVALQDVGASPPQEMLGDGDRGARDGVLGAMSPVGRMLRAASSWILKILCCCCSPTSGCVLAFLTPLCCIWKSSRLLLGLQQRPPRAPQIFGSSPAAGKLGMVRPVCVLVLAVLVAVLLALTAALTVAVAVLLAGRAEERPAAVLGCPDDWIGHRRVCFYLSTAEGSWDWSQQQCSALGASLVVLQWEWEMGFLSRLKGNDDYWLGLRRRGEGLWWVDGSSFNQTFPVHGEGECVYLNDHIVASCSCWQHRPYACSKPQAAMGQG